MLTRHLCKAPVRFQVLRYDVALTQIECRIVAIELTSLRMKCCVVANELTPRRVSSPLGESTVRPNNAFQLPPLRGPKIVGIFVTDFVLTLKQPMGGGAAERWALGGPINPVRLSCVQRRCHGLSVLDKPTLTRPYHTCNLW